jgi:holin-like protein
VIDKTAGASLDARVMLASLGLILLCQLIGEAVVRGLGLPMPGPVLGLLLLLILLTSSPRHSI